MARTKLSGHFDPSIIINDFELITRRTRWLVIFTTFLCFPFDPPRTYLVYGLVGMAALYNLTRYIPFFMRSRYYASSFTMLVVDNVFICVLLGLSGGVSTPFTGLLIFTLISATYLYKLEGTLIMVGLQLLWISYLVTHEWYPPLLLGEARTGLITAAVFIGIGIFVERLTRIQRDETHKFEIMSNEIEAQRKHLVTLVDSLSDAIFVVGGNGKILEYNAAADALSLSSGELRGEEFIEALPLRLRVNQDAKPLDLLKKKEMQHRRDLSITDTNGVVTDLDVSIQPVHLEGAGTTDFIIVCKDITKERSLDEQRTTFISVASHELRTPITIMEAALSAALLAKDKMDEQTLNVIKEAHRHCLYLASLVKDLSLLAAANNDNIPIQIERVDPGRLLRQMVHDFEAQATQKGLGLKVVVEENTPSIMSTENHIREIMQNYITNALKYSNEGTVIVRAEPTKKGGVRFSVHDTGIGISPADQKHLFTKFFRSEDFRTRQTGGTGLGLYLCTQLAQRLNGKVWCESELNKGSVFFLEVPPVSYLKRDQREVVQAEVANLVEGI